MGGGDYLYGNIVPNVQSDDNKNRRDSLVDEDRYRNPIPFLY